MNSLGDDDHIFLTYDTVTEFTPPAPRRAQGIHAGTGRRPRARTRGARYFLASDARHHRVIRVHSPALSPLARAQTNSSLHHSPHTQRETKYRHVVMRASRVRRQRQYLAPSNQHSHLAPLNNKGVPDEASRTRGDYRPATTPRHVRQVPRGTYRHERPLATPLWKSCRWEHKQTADGRGGNVGR